MTTAHSQLTLQNDPPSGGASPWPVLARIPDLSTAARSTPQRPRPITPARAPARRVDAPQPRKSADLAPVRVGEDRAEIGKNPHPPHAPLPPAHHLNQRATRGRRTDKPSPNESPILPAWDPFASPGRKLHESFAPSLSFLVMVILFTAAGTSALMLRTGDRHSDADQPGKAAQIETAADVSSEPTASGPMGIAATRLEPDPIYDPTTVTSPNAPALAPSANSDAAMTNFTSTNVTTTNTATSEAPVTDATTSDVTGIDAVPPAVPAADTDHPAIDYADPALPEANGADLPHAQTDDAPLPIARFSGVILEAPTRQAKNDDESSVH